MLPVLTPSTLITRAISGLRLWRSESFLAPGKPIPNHREDGMSGGGATSALFKALPWRKFGDLIKEVTKPPAVYVLPHRGRTYTTHF